MNMEKIHQKANDAVRLHREKHGVIHVEAEVLQELHWGMGYCHAMDRGCGIPSDNQLVTQARALDDCL